LQVKIDKILGLHRDYIGFMTGIVDGLGHEGIDLLCFDPVIAKPGVESNAGKKSVINGSSNGRFRFRTACIDATGNTNPAVNS
jgi:hypothetical protein